MGFELCTTSFRMVLGAGGIGFDPFFCMRLKKLMLNNEKTNKTVIYMGGTKFVAKGTKTIKHMYVLLFGVAARQPLLQVHNLANQGHAEGVPGHF